MTDDQNQAPDENTVISEQPTLNDSSAPTNTEQPVASEVPANQPAENVTGQPAVENPQNPPTPQTPQNPEPIPIPQLRFPFNGSFSLTFSFGSQAETEEMKKKFAQWGIIGHHGLDFALPEGTEILAVDSGKIIQSGDNGDFGISVTIQHLWGQSLSAHLKETKVNQDQEVQAGDLIGLSGQTGSAYDAHLHFAIKPSSTDQNNGYLGFIDPSSHFPFIPRSPATPDEVGQIPQQPQIIEKEIIKEVPVEKIVEKEVIKEVPVEVVKEVIKEIPVVDEVQVQQQVEERLKTELDARRIKANQTRQSKKEENLAKIEKLLGQKGEINNEDVRELLHVSQTSGTRYLEALINQGKIKAIGKGKATVYHSIFN